MHTILFSEADSNPARLTHRSPDRIEQSSILTGKRVIIVEDEGITQLQLRKVLAREGLTIVGVAMSGPEGVEIVLREKPDLVLMDIRMPGEYDGLEAARRILAERSVCIVMLTAFSDQSFQDQARQIGASGYIVKPIDKDTLLPQLEEASKTYKMH